MGRGVVKDVGGGGELYDFYFALAKTFDKIYACYLVCS